MVSFRMLNADIIGSGVECGLCFSFIITSFCCCCSDPDSDADSFYGTIERPMDIKHTESNAEDGETTCTN